MIKKSEKANPNYLAKIVKLKGLRKHPNADKLQLVDIDYQTVVTGMEAKEGDIYVYFPVECTINKDFLSFTNSYRDKTLNKDQTKSGFFEERGRVKAVKLREQKSMGYLIPVKTLEDFIGKPFKNIESYLDIEFDTVEDTLLLKKYISPKEARQNLKVKIQEPSTWERYTKRLIFGNRYNKPKDRLVSEQIHLHEDTLNLRKNIHKLNLHDIVSITYKEHGTSWMVGNVLVEKKLKLNFLQKFVKFLNIFQIKTKYLDYQIVHASRSVIRGKLGDDIWSTLRNEVEEKIPKGFTLYGECSGYDTNGKAIQSGYDYGCEPNEHRTTVYRITFTNQDNIVYELSYPQIEEFCLRYGLRPAILFFYGTVKDLIENLKDQTNDLFDLFNPEEDWQKNLIMLLEARYNNKDCYLCKNKVPEEGIVLRKESLHSFDAFKLKSTDFLLKESNDLK